MDEHLLEVYLINTARHTEETPVAEWVSLPTDAETMKAVFERLGVDGSDTEQYQASAYESSLDGLSEALKPGESLNDLNYLAALLTQRSGQGGFGYDPLFQYQTGKSFGEMTEGEKNAVSHRAVAAKEMRRLLDEVL